MAKRYISLIMSLLILLVSVGCTSASKDIYSDYYEYMYIDPETGEFVDPDTYVPPKSEDTTSSEEEVSSKEDADDGNSKESESEEKLPPATLNVADFGAKGDGKTDDSKAINDAIIELMNSGPGSKLIFGKNKVYYAKDNLGYLNRALEFQELVDAKIEGNGSTILVDGQLNYMSVRNCVRTTITGLNFDRKIRAHFVGTIYNINKEEAYFDVVSDRDFGFEGEYSSSMGDNFGFVNVEGQASRRYIYMGRLTTVNRKELKYRFYVDKEGPQGTMSTFESLKISERVIIPTPYIGQYMNESIEIAGNSDLVCKDINVWSVPRFAVHVIGNPGKLTFENFNLVPPEDEDVVHTSWRDGFHCKHNSDSIVWKNCKAVGLGDDIINISANMMYVDKRYSANEIACVFPQTNGSYGDIKEGSKVTIYDNDTGHLLAKTTIKRVINKNNNHYLLGDAVPGLKSGKNIYFYVDSHAAPNSQLINCDFEGTLRFKGAGGIAKNCRLKLYCLFMYPEYGIEGPIPHDITFSNCDFTGTWEGRLTITCNNPVSIWKEGYFRLENIKFENCKGLKRSLFSNDLNFNEKSVDYVTITPPLSE